MISTSDIVILVVASGALAVGIYRWHENTQDVSAITIPANSRMVNVEPEPVISNANTLTLVNGNTASVSTQANAEVVQVLPEATPVTNIVVPETETETQRLGSHRVVSGDYLSKLAQQYGTDTQTLRDINGISGSVIRIGDEILYPL